MDIQSHNPAQLNNKVPLQFPFLAISFSSRRSLFGDVAAFTVTT